MKFFDYLESTHVSTNIQQQVEYTPYGQGKIMAGASLINGQRSFLKWVNYLVLVANYLLIVIGLKRAPQSAHDLIADLKAKSEEQLKEQKSSLDLERQALVQAHLDAQAQTGQVQN